MSGVDPLCGGEVLSAAVVDGVLRAALLHVQEDDTESVYEPDQAAT